MINLKKIYINKTNNLFTIIYIYDKICIVNNKNKYKYIIYIYIKL
jgi:hypothetical protein